MALTLVGTTVATTQGIITSSSAAAFAVGLNGATTPALNIDASAATSVTGLNIASKAAGSNVVITTLSSGSNESLTIDGKGTGTVILQVGTAPAAGGSAQARVGFSSTALLGLYFGTGAPSVSAGKGSIYVNTTASTTTTRLYINTDGGTTWTAFTSAA